MSHQQTLSAMYAVEKKQEQLLPLTAEEVGAHVDRYTRAKIPWDYLSKYYQFRKALDCKHIIKPELKVAEDPMILTDSFEAVDAFFRDDGRAKFLPEIGQYADYWILFRVTAGRVRRDHNKKMRIFKYEKPVTMTELRWAHVLKTSDPSDWVPIRDDDRYPMFVEITDTCNDVLSGLRRRLQDLEIKTNSGKVAFENLNRHPEFVPFQANRSREHQKFLWKYQAKKRGGNQGYEKPENPLCIAKQSVHFLLRELHEWLPSFRRRRPKETVVV